MRRLILFVPLLVIMAMFFLFQQMIDHDPTEMELARKDKPVPAFALPGLRNPERFFTQEDLKGKPMLVNVWATWCPSCRVEHPYLLKLAKEKGVQLVGLNYKDDRTAALEWLDKLGDPYVFTVFDEEGRLGLDLGVYGAPETYVVDAEGIIRYRHVGVVNEKVWNEVLAPLMEDSGTRESEVKDTRVNESTGSEQGASS
ncbi:DsbE family thiol:disulfide interchange protein [Hahella ganghwensis]|uniref:DsbE family thiol:disulfide interchange protein n=1 Tax=Hahella ganghwensis TaxID=286420 RepID=UPI00036C09FC|nr:DsbE family thiol:disulfide interchange protein [Hahella ganghwensis]